jgi:hypothetical protein
MSSTAAQQLQQPGRSTGPRSTAGKATVSRNALRHGMTATKALLPGEDPVEFEELLHGLHVELEPATVVERALVDRLANAFLRMRRADEFATGVLEAEGASADGVGKAFWRDAMKSDGLGKALRHGSRAERSALVLLHELQRLKAARLNPNEPVALPLAIDVSVTTSADLSSTDAEE